MLRKATLCAAALVGTASAGAFASGGGGDGGSDVSFQTVLNVTSIVTAAVTLGGAALVAAFGVGGGFRIAKKAYSWVLGRL